MQSPTSTSPVGSSGLTVPSGRGRTTPSTATTYSLRTSTVPAPRTGPCRCGRGDRRRPGARRARAAWPPSRTRSPSSRRRRGCSVPHIRVRIEVARSDDRWAVTGWSFRVLCGSGSRADPGVQPVGPSPAWVIDQPTVGSGIGGRSRPPTGRTSARRRSLVSTGHPPDGADHWPARPAAARRPPERAEGDLARRLLVRARRSAPPRPPTGRPI